MAWSASARLDGVHGFLRAWGPARRSQSEAPAKAGGMVGQEGAGCTAHLFVVNPGNLLLFNAPNQRNGKLQEYHQLNAVEIEEAISQLADQPFDPESFPYAFLEAFGNKATTIKRLKSGSSNSSDIEGGVLQRNNIHMAVCGEGDVTKTLGVLKNSPATGMGKAKFILVTDGVDLEAEDVTSGETVACQYSDFPNHFGFFLHLAGITTVKQVRESSFDIRATSRLNKLYIELLKDNPDWGTADQT